MVTRGCDWWATNAPSNAADCPQGHSRRSRRLGRGRWLSNEQRWQQSNPDGVATRAADDLTNSPGSLRSRRMSRASSRSCGRTTSSYGPPGVPSAAPAPTFVCRSTHSISALRSREQSRSASGSLPTTLTRSRNGRREAPAPCGVCEPDWCQIPPAASSNRACGFSRTRVTDVLHRRHSASPATAGWAGGDDAAVEVDEAVAIWRAVDDHAPAVGSRPPLAFGHEEREPVGCVGPHQEEVAG
jgi:hypothetical protein